MRSSLLFLFAAFILLLTSCTSNNEIAQWRGPLRDGHYPDTKLLKVWPKAGPALVLKIEDIGKGLSQPVVYDNVIYLSGLKSDSLDVLSAYNMDGSLRWEKVYSRAWQRSYPESRGTPSIENNRIYLVGGAGKLVCLSTNKGEILWEKNPLAEFEGKYMHWGNVESVLLTDKAALYVTGGDKTTVVAYDKKTGELLWQSKSMGGAKSYASSCLVERGGLKIALIQTQNDLLGINADNGDVLWSYNTMQYHSKKGKGEAANTPLYRNGDVFTTYGNEQPGLMLHMADDGLSIALKWRNDILDTHHGGLVVLDGTIYASNMIDNTRGNWASVNWETGETNWEKPWFTKGSVITADDMLYFYEEKHGNVALVQPDTEDLKVVSTFKVNDGEGPHWAHPSIYKGKLFIRHGSVLMVYALTE